MELSTFGFVFPHHIQQEPVMNTPTFIFSYVAKMHPKGSIKGRVEARTGLEAKELIKSANLMVESVTVKVLANQTAARKERYESIQ